MEADAARVRDAELQALARAIAVADRRSYLDAVDAERRRLQPEFISDDLLRKPATAVQKRRMRTLADDLADQAHSRCGLSIDGHSVAT